MGDAGETLGQPVFLTFDQLSAVLGKMGELLPPDASFSFNHDSEKAWIVAANGIDLHTLVEQALAQLGQKIETPKTRQRSGAANRSVLGA
jgi:epoxyqueuosine reductase QueG